MGLGAAGVIISTFDIFAFKIRASSSVGRAPDS
ncbi:MAG: hypothetical protein K0R92_611 [Lachnospiraceae bacterium]|nr:hypothetical protein [Lachnospiraceae bacterium]